MGTFSRDFLFHCPGNPFYHSERFSLRRCKNGGVAKWVIGAERRKKREKEFECQCGPCLFPGGHTIQGMNYIVCVSSTFFFLVFLSCLFPFVLFINICVINVFFIFILQQTLILLITPPKIIHSSNNVERDYHLRGFVLQR